MTSPRRFVVTGSASGIGLQVTERLARSGHCVLATDLSTELLRERASAGGWPGSVLCRRLDVTSIEDWSAALDEVTQSWGGLDVLYNIAGYLQPGRMHELALEDVDRHFDVNVKGVAYGMRLASELMVAQRSGHIVNLGSMSSFAPIPGISLYSASKYAVRAMSLAAAIELRELGVHVSVVCPDAVDTPFIGRHRDDDDAALIFSGLRELSADEVAAVLTGPVLDRQPMELALPNWRKWLARVADLAPTIGPWVQPLLQRRGLARQREGRSVDGNRTAGRPAQGAKTRKNKGS